MLSGAYKRFKMRSKARLKYPNPPHMAGGLSQGRSTTSNTCQQPPPPQGGGEEQRGCRQAPSTNSIVLLPPAHLESQLHTV